MIKESNALPNQIKISLEKGKNIDKEWENENKLNYLINDCINIENNILYIYNLNKNLIKCKSIQFDVKFNPEKDGIKKFGETIKRFGRIFYDNLKFKKCPNNINEKRKYIVSGEKENILTKTGTDKNWMGTICENKLDKFREYKWKIKIIKSNDNNIMVGVAPSDFDINSSSYDNCGWYYNLKDSCYYSGPPYNYNKKVVEKIVNNIKRVEEKYEIKDKDIDIKKSFGSKSSNVSKKSIESRRSNISSIRSKKRDESKESRSSHNCSNHSKESRKFSSSFSSKKSNKSKESKKSNDSSFRSKKSKKSKEIRKSSNSSSIKSNISKKSSPFNDKKYYKNENYEIILSLNYEKKILKFMKDNKEKGKYTDIPMDKPVFPAVFLYNKNDSIEIEEY